MSAIKLWFLREGDIVRCYGYEGDAEVPPLPGGRRVAGEGQVLSPLIFCELLDESRRVIGFTSDVDTITGEVRSFFEGSSNARILERGEYIIALGESVAELDELERRKNMDAAESWNLSCGFDCYYALEGGGIAIQAHCWWDWEDRERRILRCCGDDGPVFALPVGVIEHA